MMIEINSQIFRGYDIRGIYPREINEPLAERIGEIFLNFLKGKKIVVGMDGRTSSLSLKKALFKGLKKRGAKIFDLGLCPTELVYFALFFLSADGGIMITSSHNPKEYNGFKIVKRGKEGALFLSGEKIKEKIFEKAKFQSGGSLKKVNIFDKYLDYLFKISSPQKIKPFKIVVDGSNGVASLIVSKIEKRLPLKIFPLNFKIDGNFSAHSPNPLEKGAVFQIKKEILKRKADFGFIFDGDGDRIFLIDERGKFLPAEIPLLLLARHFLSKRKGERIVYNLTCSQKVPQFIKKWKGRPIKSPVGYINISKRMRVHQAVMGGESSGHFSFRDYFFSDSAFLTFLLLLEEISKEEGALSQIVRSFALFPKEEISFPVKDKEKILKKALKKFKGKKEFLDGITFYFKDCWFNIRPSNTEEKIRVTIEAKKLSLLKEKKKELTELIIKN